MSYLDVLEHFWAHNLKWSILRLFHLYNNLLLWHHYGRRTCMGKLMFRCCLMANTIHSHCFLEFTRHDLISLLPHGYVQGHWGCQDHVYFGTLVFSLNHYQTLSIIYNGINLKPHSTKLFIFFMEKICMGGRATNKSIKHEEMTHEVWDQIFQKGVILDTNNLSKFVMTNVRRNLSTHGIYLISTSLLKISFKIV